MTKYDPASTKAVEFINHEEILETLDYGRANAHNRDLIKAILEKRERPRVYPIGRLLYFYHPRKMTLMKRFSTLPKILSTSFTPIGLSYLHPFTYQIIV